MSIITKPEFWILLVALLLLIGAIIAFAVVQEFEWYVWLLLGLSLGLFFIGIIWMIARYFFYRQPCNEVVEEDDTIDYDEEKVVVKDYAVDNMVSQEPGPIGYPGQVGPVVPAPVAVLQEPVMNDTKIFREVDGDFVEYTVESSQDLDSNVEQKRQNIAQRGVYQIPVNHPDKIMVDRTGSVVNRKGIPAIDGSGKPIKVHSSGIVTDAESVPIKDRSGSGVALHSSGAIVNRTGSELKLNNAGTVVDRTGTPVKDRKGKNVTVDRSGSVRDKTGRTITIDSNGGVRDRAGIPVVAGTNGQIRINSDRTVVDGKGTPIRDSRGGRVSLDRTNTLIDSRGRTVTVDNKGTIVDSTGETLTDSIGNKVRDNIRRNVRLNRSGIISDESGEPIRDNIGRTFSLDVNGTVIDTKGTPVRDSNGNEVSVDRTGTIRDGRGGEVVVDKAGNVVDSEGISVSVNDSESFSSSFSPRIPSRVAPLPPVSTSGSLRSVPATPIYRVPAPVERTMSSLSRTRMSPPTPVYRAENYGIIPSEPSIGEQSRPVSSSKPTEQEKGLSFSGQSFDPNQTHESLNNPMYSMKSNKDCDNELVREVTNPRCRETFQDKPETVQYREGDKLITKTTTNTRVVERVISPIAEEDIITKNPCIDDLDDLQPTFYT